MADKSSQLILTALSRAAADPAGAPLHGSKAVPGLFPATAAGKQAAQRCRDEGYLRPLTPDPSPPGGGEGRSAGASDREGPPATGTTLLKKTSAAHEAWALTDRGWSYLLSQASPRPVLEDFVRALEARHAQAGELLAVARHMQTTLEAFKANAEKVLQHLPRAPLSDGAASPPGHLNALFEGFRQEANGGRPPENNGHVGGTGGTPVLQYLTRWQESGTSEDCPLPDLFRHLQGHDPALTIGRFHDVLRHLHAAEQVYLHPWTGPLYDIPEPRFALIVGHEIAYYASLRQG